LIEFSHRLTSGLALVSVVALFFWTWRACRRGHPARPAAALSLFFMLSEAGVGAGLVLFQLVADNASFARAMFLAVHLVNTFTLLACLTTTAWWLSGGERLRLHDRWGQAFYVALLCAGVLIASTSGAVAALGDTLYPATSLSEGLWADLSMTSHVLIRLRVFHPILAVAAALALMASGPRLAEGQGPTAARFARTLSAFAGLQIALGILNVFLLAPIWLQLLHLLVADAVWVALILLGVTVLGEPADARFARAAPDFRLQPARSPEPAVQPPLGTVQLPLYPAIRYQPHERHRDVNGVRDPLIDERQADCTDVEQDR
jgi:heme A synthase